MGAKLFAIIKGESSSFWRGQTRKSFPTDSVEFGCSASFHHFGYQKLGGFIDISGDRTQMIAANDGVPLPMTYLCLFIRDGYAAEGRGAPVGVQSQLD